jgi:hypothetical protein
MCLPFNYNNPETSIGLLRLLLLLLLLLLQITAYGYGTMELTPACYALNFVDPPLMSAALGLGGIFITDFEMLWSRVAADLASSGVGFIYNARITSVSRSSRRGNSIRWEPLTVLITLRAVQVTEGALSDLGSALLQHLQMLQPTVRGTCCDPDSAQSVKLNTPPALLSTSGLSMLLCPLALQVHHPRQAQQAPQV